MEPQQEEAMEQQDPGVEGFAGLAQSEQAKMQAAESLKDSQPEVAQLLQQSAQLAVQALDMLQGGKGSQPAQSGNPDIAGTNAMPADMRSR